MSRHKLALVVLMFALAAAAMTAEAGARGASADATSFTFSPSVINLDGTGDSETVDLVVAGLGTDAADTVQVNIQHNAQFSVSSPVCGPLYSGVGGFGSSATVVTGGTVFICSLADGPSADSGVVASLTITKNDEVTGGVVLDLLDSGPFRTTFFESGVEVLPGTLGTLAVWDLLDPIADQSVNEGVVSPLTFDVTSSSDGPVPNLSHGVTGPGPGPYPFISFTDNGDGTGSFSISPGFDDSGTYAIDVTSDNMLAAETVSFSLEVFDQNQPPVLAAIGDQTVAEADSLPLALSASDPDSADSLSFSATVDLVAVPTGFAVLSDAGDGTATLTFSPGFLDEGTYSVAVTVADDHPGGTMSDSETFTLTVTNTNQDPVVTPVGPQTVDEGSTLDLGISATDPDGQSITLSATIDGNDVPFGFASISATVADAATLTFATSVGDVGVYDIVVTAVDGAGGLGTTSFQLTVAGVASVTAPAGTVTLQGVNPGPDHDTQFALIGPLVELVRVSDDGVVGTVSVAPDGSFMFNNVVRDVYYLRISAPGYMTHVLGATPPDQLDLTVSDFSLAALPVMMLGGLVDGGNADVNGLDISILLASVGDTADPGIGNGLLNGRLDGSGNIVDINGDGAVTGGDVSVVISNLGLSDDQPWQ